MSQHTFIPHRSNCWITRLQGPQPRMAATMAANDAVTLATVSTTANMLNFFSREMRALGTERLPLIGKIKVSAIRMGTIFGSDISRAMGAAAKESAAAIRSEVAIAIQK